MSSFGSDPAIRHSFIPDSFSDIYLNDEYEAILDDLLTPRYSVDQNGVPSLYPDSLEGRGGQLDHAWSRLSDLLGDTEDISDSESVGSVGMLDFGSDSGSDDGSSVSEQRGWAEMSRESITSLRNISDQASQPKSFWLWKKSETIHRACLALHHALLVRVYEERPQNQNLLHYGLFSRQ